MSAGWAKFKMWLKIITFGLAAIYVLVFILLNRGLHVRLDFLFRQYENVNVLLLLLLTSISSIIGWWLFKAVFATVRQIRQSRRRADLERIEKDHNQMLSKAAKLQMKPASEPEA